VGPSLVSFTTTDTDEQKCHSPWCTLRYTGNTHDHFIDQRSRISIRSFSSGRLSRSLARDLRRAHDLRAPCLVKSQSIRSM